MRFRPLLLVGIAAASALATTASLAAAPAMYSRPGTTSRVSVAHGGTEASYPAVGPDGGQLLGSPPQSDISVDGRYVAFSSDATNLASHVVAKSGFFQIYRRDLKLGVTQLASTSSDGTPGLGQSSRPSISADGRYVAFTSAAANLVAGDTNVAPDVFWHDMTTGQTRRVSVATDGSQAVNETPQGALQDESDWASISNDGQRIAFHSLATNLAPGVKEQAAACGCVEYNQYVHDLRAHRTTLVSIGYDGKPAGGEWGSISGNGRYVAFTGSTGVVREVTHSTYDVYVRDLVTRQTRLASASSDGTHAGKDGLTCGLGLPAAELPPPLGSATRDSKFLCAISQTLVDSSTAQVMSDDGRFVTFVSTATNLVPNPGVCSDATDALAGCTAKYVKDMRTGRVERIDVTSVGESRSRLQTSSGLGMTMSGDGRFIAYVYPGGGGAGCQLALPIGTSQLAAVGCDRLDTYLYDRFAGSMETISAPVGGSQPTAGKCYPTDRVTSADSWLGGISGNGRMVSFFSSAQNMVPKDANNHCDTFVRDRGTALGVGGLTGAPPTSAPTPGCGLPVCPPLPLGAGLLQARVIPRQGLQDLFIRWDVSRMAPVSGAPAGGLLYDLRFTSGDQHYAVRAQRIAGPDFDSAGGASFGLFRETVPGVWTHVASLKGGYGTVGDAVVAAVPLALLGGKAQLTDVTASTAVGSYLSGPTKVLDSLRLSR